MPSRFGEAITNQDAYDTARGAAGQMSNGALARAAADASNGPNQRRAAADELAARETSG